MSMKSNSGRSIPSVLSVPEKISSFYRRVLKFRFPWNRQFSLRDLLLTFGAIAILLLQALIPMPELLQKVFKVLALLFVLIPVVMQVLRMITEHRFPVEEVTVILAAVLAFVLKLQVLSVAVVSCAVLLWQIEAYTLLHVDAAPNALTELDEIARKKVLAANDERSAERRITASVAVLIFAVFALLFLVFLIIWLFHLKSGSAWLQRCLVTLILASPVAVLFCSRLTHFGAIFSSAKINAFFSSDQIPENFAKCKVFAFGKTGTVTDGKFQILEIMPVGISQEDLLRIAAVAECKSDHPIAVALKNAAGLREGVIPSGVLDVQEVPGKGVSTFFSGRQIYVGNASLLDDHDIWYQVPSKSGTAIHVAIDSTYRGYILVSDTIRENAFDALEELRANGAESLVMLTGDVPSVSRVMASALNFDMVKSQLSSEEKASAVNYLRSTHGDRSWIAAVGDGNHDTAMFEASDVSVSFRINSEQVSDLVICSDDILSLPLVYRICKETERIFYITLFGISGIKLLLCILGLSGVLPLGILTLINFSVEAGAVIYSLTSLTLENQGYRK